MHALNFLIAFSALIAVSIADDDSSVCPFCMELVDPIVGAMNVSQTSNSVHSAAYQLCIQFDLDDSCSDALGTYYSPLFNGIIEYLTKYLTPHVICQTLKFCNPAEKDSLEAFVWTLIRSLMGDSNCLGCQMLVDPLVGAVNDSKGLIQQLTTSICSDSHENGWCLGMVEYFYSPVFNYIIGALTNTRPFTTCVNLGFC